MIFSLFWEGAFIRRGAFIRGGVFILKSEILGGVYSRRGVYSRKYGMPGLILTALILFELFTIMSWK